MVGDITALEINLGSLLSHAILCSSCLTLPLHRSQGQVSVAEMNLGCPECHLPLQPVTLTPQISFWLIRSALMSPPGQVGKDRQTVQGEEKAWLDQGKVLTRTLHSPENKAFPRDDPSPGLQSKLVSKQS